MNISPRFLRCLSKQMLFSCVPALDFLCFVNSLTLRILSNRFATSSSEHHRQLREALLRHKIERKTAGKMIDCQCHSRGSIHLILGPMFSGKTTELFRLTNRHKLAGKKVAIVKYLADMRYDVTMASTHDSHKMEAISALKLADVIGQLDNYEVIGIDEGQFFVDVVDYSQQLANAGKVVIIAALNGDYRQKYYENIAMLVACAERIEKLSAVCRNCGHSASFTFRYGQSTKREVIGGEDLYQAVCRACYIHFESQQHKHQQCEKGDGANSNGGGNNRKSVSSAAAGVVTSAAVRAAFQLADAPAAKLARRVSFGAEPPAAKAAVVST